MGNENTNIIEESVILTEVKRRELLDKSKKGANYAPSNQALGKNRYERRRHSSISKRISDYSKIDMNTFFKRDILTFSVEVRGETNNYKVKLKLNGVLEELQKVLRSTKKPVEWKNIAYAISTVLNNGDVYINCDCLDFTYRFNHWSHVHGYASSKDDPGPGLGIANPNDDKGASCKHGLLVLANKDWVMKVTSTINNYIHYMQERQERLYQSIIFPAVYGQRYSDEIQQQLFNPDTGKTARNYLNTGKDTINKANEIGKTRTQFKKGNTQGVRFAKTDNDEPDQVQLDLDNNELEDEE